jgi:hypothetical protein
MAISAKDNYDIEEKTAGEDKTVETKTKTEHALHCAHVWGACPEFRQKLRFPAAPTRLKPNAVKLRAATGRG